MLHYLPGSEKVSYSEKPHAGKRSRVPPHYSAERIEVGTGGFT